MNAKDSKLVPNKAYLEIFSEIQTVLKDKNAIVMAKVGINLGERWAQSLRAEGRYPQSIRELFEWMTDYLQNELLFASKVELIQNGNKFYIRYGEFDSNDIQCLLCVGNMVKEKGGTSACPISSFIMGAYRVFNKELNIKRLQLEKIVKPESKKAGSCEQRFLIELRT